MQIPTPIKIEGMESLLVIIGEENKHHDLLKNIQERVTYANERLGDLKTHADVEKDRNKLKSERAQLVSDQTTAIKDRMKLDTDISALKEARLIVKSWKDEGTKTLQDAQKVFNAKVKRQTNAHAENVRLINEEKTYLLSLKNELNTVRQNQDARDADILARFIKAKNIIEGKS